MREILPNLIEFLQHQGILHVEEVPLSVESIPGFLHRVHLTDEQRTEAETLEQLSRSLLEVVPLLTAPSTPEEVRSAAAELGRARPDEWRRAARGWSRELRSLTRRKLNIQDNLEVLGNFERTLGVVARLLGTRSVVLGQNACAFVLNSEVERALDRLRTRCQTEVGSEATLFYEQTGRSAAVGVITYPEAHDGTVRNMLREERIGAVDIPDKALGGASVQDVLTKVEEHKSSDEADLERIREELVRFSREAGPRVRALQSVVSDRLSQLRITNRLAASELTGVVHGWAPSEEVPAFLKALEDRFGGQVAVGRLPIERIDRQRVPTLLKNHPVFQPFEVLLSLFNPPTYGSIDPSPLVGVFFVLFYGFILGDVVYGLVVLALALWLRRRFAGHRIVRAAATVGVYMGTSAVVFGVLFGEYCGDLGHREFGLNPLWFHRGDDTMLLLLVAVAVGVVHIVLSLAFGIREELRHHSRRHALEKLGLLLGLCGVGVGVLSYAGVSPFDGGGGVVGTLVLLAGCAALLVRSSGAMAPLHMMEVLSLVTNVLSYSRLMALGIASLVLADVANDLARESASPLIGIPLAGMLHVLNVGLGMFSPTLHSLRLNYVESLPKFYSPEGRSYQPFRKEAL
jgi:V/A-type H+-transporting ATPase subunit I